MKKSLLLFIIFMGFVKPVWTASFTADVPPEGALVHKVTCAIQMNQTEYKVAEPMEFQYVCESEDGADFEIPRNILYYVLGAGEGIMVRDASGVEYKFMPYPFRNFAFFPEPEFFESGDLVKALGFPGCCKGELRLVESKDWIDVTDIAPSSDDPMSIFETGLIELPAGKYEAWLDIQFYWQTYAGNNMDLLVDSNKDQAKWWRFESRPATVAFEVIADETDNNGKESRGE